MTEQLSPASDNPPGNISLYCAAEGRAPDPLGLDVARIGRLDAVPRILEVICRTTGMGFAAVARVTPERWVACAVHDEFGFGLAPGCELEVAATICREVRQSGQAVVIDDVADDPAWCDHPTPRRYGLRSYIAVPIRVRGEVFGVLCAVDPEPAPLKDSQALAMCELFAQLVGNHLETQEELALSEAALTDAQATAELRDQFIAVLGHDLRNPLAAIAGGARLLGKSELGPRARFLLDQVEASVDRMAGLIDNVLDFARGRLGGGLVVERRADPDLATTLALVVDELRTGQPERVIEAEIAVDQPVAGDGRRIAQLFSNLLANALTHGDPRAPVRAQARTVDGRFELSVANAGAPIPPDIRARLFQPFTRASVSSQQGLGLGLYIAAEIARAHDGSLEVTSDAAETRFTFRAPLG